MRFSSDFVKSIYPRTILLFERDIDWRITGRWTLYAALVGLVTALAAVLYAKAVALMGNVLLIDGAGYPMPFPGGEAPRAFLFDLNRALHPLRPWLLPILPALGGLAAGVLMYRFVPEAVGHGTDAAIHAFHHERGNIPGKVSIVKTIASALIIGSGGSAGREGPAAQLGAGLGSVIARKLRLSDRERRILLVSGIAAGIASIFRAPLGGAIFAVEVLYREDIESEALMPAVIAAITGYSVYSSLTESGAVFITPAYRFVNPLAMLPLLIFAVLCAVSGILYVSMLHGTKRSIFGRLPLPVWVKPGIGGLAVGCIAFFFPAVLGSSYGWLQQAIDGNLPVTLMLLLAFAKMVSTSLTVGSGGPGGTFAPSLVIGGMLGGVFGNVLHFAMPQVVVQPEAYVMIGMATFMAGAANVPLATTIMISEITGSYTLLVPLLLSCVIVHVTSRRWSLYPEQVPTHQDSPAHRANMTPDLLRRTKVEAVVEHPVYYHTLVPSHTLPEVLSVFSRTKEMLLPVIKLDTVVYPGTVPYTGLVLLEDIQALLASEASATSILIVADMQVPFASVQLDDTLDKVLDVFVETNYPELPVLNDRRLIVGFIKQGQVINEYYREYIRQKAAEETLA